jgi:hypothetical protein
MLAVVLSLVFATAASVAVAVPSGASGQSGLAELRDATARFHNLQATAASGRVDLHLCVNQMGQPFANPSTFSDGKLDPLDPEAMVYADDGRGHLRLVAVEWVNDQPGTVMGIPLHFNPSVNLWVLHAWVWAPNPAGMFADMNPRIGNCP